MKKVYTIIISDPEDGTEMRVDVDNHQHLSGIDFVSYMATATSYMAQATIKAGLALGLTEYQCLKLLENR